MIKLDLQSRIPLYEQLEEQIIRLSLLGVLDEHEQLPSVRALARDVGVNPNTVAKAYQELERQGIIYTVTGKGSFVSPDVLSLEQPRKAALEEVFAAVDKALSRGLSKEQLLDSIREQQFNNQVFYICNRCRTIRQTVRRETNDSIRKLDQTI